MRQIFKTEIERTEGTVTVISDHGGNHTIFGIAKMGNGEYAALIDTKYYFSLNRIYLKDGEVRISTRSIGPTAHVNSNNITIEVMFVSDLPVEVIDITSKEQLIKILKGE